MKINTLMNRGIPGSIRIVGSFLALLFLLAIDFTPIPGAITSAYAAGGNLMLTPHRIVFEGRQRSAEVSLMNQGTTTETYRVSFKNLRMLEDGNYKDIETPIEGENFSDKIIRYSPRQVTLKPGEAQTVRLLLRKKKSTKPGEYRSHLYVRTIPPETSGESLEAASKLGDDQISVQLIPVFGITIPVIARVGKGSASIELSDAKMDFSGEKPVLSFSMHREGNFSSFGDIEVTLGAGGSDTVIGMARGVAVYSPNKMRTFALRLNPEVGLKGKTLHLVYRNIPENGGKVIAEMDIQTP